MQSIIGASRAIAFDLTAACSGFVVGLVTAAQFVRGGSYSNVLVIGADALSRYVDWRDRGDAICVLLALLLLAFRPSLLCDPSTCLVRGSTLYACRPGACRHPNIAARAWAGAAGGEEPYLYMVLNPP